jgi:uncharacterized protein (TIGR01619 family)
MGAMWDFYICDVNDVVASIYLNLGLRDAAPERERPNLLWVWVEMKWPGEDGLSSNSEFDKLCEIEDQMTETMKSRFEAAYCGRITTDGRREFYYYAAGAQGLEQVVEEALAKFKGHEFECGSKPDPEWTQYLDVLYPSEETRQSMENRRVLDVLEKNGDTLARPRDVWHWISFRRDVDRKEFLAAVVPLEYRLQSESDTEGKAHPKRICVVRFQSVEAGEIDDAATELFRLAKKHGGEYDGWETQMNPD